MHSFTCWLILDGNSVIDNQLTRISVLGSMLYSTLTPVDKKQQARSSHSPPPLPFLSPKSTRKGTLKSVIKFVWYVPLSCLLLLLHQHRSHITLPFIFLALCWLVQIIHHRPMGQSCKNPLRYIDKDSSCWIPPRAHCSHCPQRVLQGQKG